MMNRTMRLLSVFAFIFLLLFTSTSCKKRKSVSELRREERQAISRYIEENNINVIHELPADTVFVNEKDYYKSSSGLYIHIVDKGTGIPPRTGEMVIVRFYEMNMQGDTIIRAMESNQYRNAYEFKFNSGETSKAFNEAAGYMGEDGEAYLIVPSSIGFESAKQNIIPCRYHIKTSIY